MRKGQQSFIKILEKLDFDYQYWLIGGGEDYETIKAYCEDHHLEDKIKLIGYVSHNELYKYYSAADIYAHASIAEGQSLSEIEAYTTGMRTAVNKKIIGTVISELSDIRYFVYDEDNFEYEQFKEWIKKGRNERKTSFLFDWSAIAGKYAECYKEVYNRKK